MAEKTLTSASAILKLAIGGIFPVPQTIEGFSADNLFSSDTVPRAEVVMGADGKMSAGYVPAPVQQTIVLLPSSPSMYVFETWIMAMSTAREVFFAEGEVTYKATGRKYILTKGVLVEGKIMPDAKKLLQPVEFRITWESVNPSYI